MLYKTTDYLTLTGTVTLVSLSDFAYGEWIVYDKKKPKYHINAFDDVSYSNVLVNTLLENKKGDYRKCY